MDVFSPAAATPVAFFDQLESPISLYSAGSSSSCSTSTLESDVDEEKEEGQDVYQHRESYTPVPRSPFITSPMRAHLWDTSGTIEPTTPTSASSFHSFSLSRFRTKSAPSRPPKTLALKTKPAPEAGKGLSFFRRKASPAPRIRISAPTPILVPAHIRTHDPRAVHSNTPARPRTGCSDVSTKTATTITTTLSTDTTDTTATSCTSATYTTNATSIASSSRLDPNPYPSPPLSSSLMTLYGAQLAPCMGTKPPLRDREGRVNEWIASQLSLPLPLDEIGAGAAKAQWSGGEGTREIPVLSGIIVQHMEDERVRLRQIAKRGKGLYHCL